MVIFQTLFGCHDVLILTSKIASSFDLKSHKVEARLDMTISVDLDVNPNSKSFDPGGRDPTCPRSNVELDRGCGGTDILSLATFVEINLPCLLFKCHPCRYR